MFCTFTSRHFIKTPVLWFLLRHSTVYSHIDQCVKKKKKWVVELYLSIVLHIKPYKIIQEKDEVNVNCDKFIIKCTAKSSFGLCCTLAKFCLIK